MDNLFKALLIIILVAFLYLYYENTNNDRYYIEGNVVFDKKTGTIYSGLSPISGIVTSKDVINGTKRVYPWRDIKDDK